MAVRFGVGLIFPWVILASASEASEADRNVCAETAPAGIEGVPAAEIDFVRVDLLPAEQVGGDGPFEEEVVSFDRDVLLSSPAAAGADIAFVDSELRVSGVICIEYRPEMLALLLHNAGAARDQTALRAEVLQGGETTVLYGVLPSFGTGETRHVLLSSSMPLANAEAIMLWIQRS